MLVHGTFAQDASWTKPGSPIYDAIARNYPGANITRFGWSGANSVFERRSASMALAQLLKKNTEEDRPTYIVAHSHGGNVAVEAMVALGDYQNFGICCLATPFFHAKPRSMTALGKAPLIWGLSGIFISLSAICSALLGESSYRIPLTSFLIGLGAFLGLYLGSMIETLEELSGYYSGQTHSTVPGDLNLHIIRVSGDEASLVLGFGQILAWASNRLYGMVLRGFQFSLFVSPFKRPWFSVGAAIIFTVLVAVIYTIYPEDHLTLMGRAYKLFWPLRLASLAFAVLLIGSITRIYDRLLLGLTLVGVLISSLLVCKVVGTKDHHSLLNGTLKAFCIDVDTEAAPAGVWHIAQFSKADRAGTTQSELVHSIYVEERVQEEVISCIKWSEDFRENSEVRGVFLKHE